jgi:integrase
MSDLPKNICIRGGQYYWRARVHGKDFLRASPYADLPSTTRWAKAMMDQAKARRGDSLAETKARSEYVSAAELLAAYRAAAAEQFALDGKPSRSTVEKNCTSLLYVLRVATGAQEPGEVRIDRITPELLGGYVRDRVAAAKGNELDVQRARISSAGMARFVKSVFARWTAPYYARAGIRIPPCITELRSAVKSCKPPPYQPRPPALIERTHQEALKLAQEHPDQWAAYLLCYRFGLRAGEAAAAQWRWIERDHAGQRVLRICRRPDWKGPKNLRDHSIPATEETWAALDALKGKSPFIVPGPTLNWRYAVITKDLADWMSGLGWGHYAEYKKRAHELRKLAGCVWLTSAGLTWAAAWLGDNPITVAHFYSTVLGSGTAVKM